MGSHRLYVGTIGEGLFRSLDGGETFTRACEGMFVECHVRALAVHPRDPRNLYLGTEQGLFVSRDGADHWTRVESPLDGRQIWSILLLPHAPEVMLVGTCPARLFRSEDAGLSWQEARVTMEQHCPRIMHTRVTSLLADPAALDTVWAGVEIDGLYRSRDAGRTWEKTGSGLSSQDIHALAIADGPRQSRHFLAATNNDLNLSTDNGATWKPLGIAKWMPWSYCRTLAQPSGRPEIVLLGNGDAPPGSAGDIGRSCDGGLTWQPSLSRKTHALLVDDRRDSDAHQVVPISMPRANSTIWNFAVSDADPNLIYASSVSGEIYRSTDQGATWHKLAREFGEIRALAWTP